MGEALEEIAETNDGRAKIMLKTKVEKLVTDASGNVCGVEATNNKGERFIEKGPVIIATGGFGVDFADGSLLGKHRPDLMHLPTTNGEHCTGDGLKMSMAVGAKTVDLEWVQVHPTGLVHPDEPDAKVKFLAAEALRGCGGVLLDINGNRFANELGRRDYVTGMMWKNKGVQLGSTAGFFLCLNGKAYKNMHEFAKEYNIPVDNIEATFKNYNEIAD